MRRLALLTALAVAVATSGASAAKSKNGNGKSHWRDGYERSYRAEPYYGYERYDRYRQQVHIPPGHRPPPGLCRIWYPDRPPGHQPPAGDCRWLSWRLPPGAILVH
jgi:hypothetical protein